MLTSLLLSQIVILLSTMPHQHLKELFSLLSPTFVSFSLIKFAISIRTLGANYEQKLLTMLKLV